MIVRFPPLWLSIAGRCSVADGGVLWCCVFLGPPFLVGRAVARGSTNRRFACGFGLLGVF